MNTSTTLSAKPRELLGDPLHNLALGFGTGCAPVMPGTAGTLVGVAFYLLLVQVDILWYLFACAMGFGIGIALCGRTGTALGAKDHPAIVWDEIVGMLVTMAAVPVRWYWLVGGFVLFRLLDIVKPGPVGWLDQRLTGGLGVMVDDLAAALIACGVLHLLVYIL